MIINRAGVLLLGIGLAIAAPGIHAHPAAQTFAVASIKPSAPPDPGNPLTMFPGVVLQPDGSLHATNAPLVVPCSLRLQHRGRSDRWRSRVGN